MFTYEAKTSRPMDPDGLRRSVRAHRPSRRLHRQSRHQRRQKRIFFGAVAMVLAVAALFVQVL